MSSTELVALDVSEEQARTKVYRHPEREVIHSLLRNGRSAEWISKWLKSKYPTEDEHGGEVEDADRNARWQLAAATIARYRSKWMPECAPGVDLIDQDLEEAIGRRLPAPRQIGARYELEVMEIVIQTSMASLARAVKADKDMEMLQGVTLEATKTLAEAARSRLEMAQSLGVPGYEKVADVSVQKIDQNVTSRNVNVELHGQVDSNGVVHAKEPEKVGLLRKLMEMDPADARGLVDTAERMAGSTEGTAEEVVEEPPAAAADEFDVDFDQEPAADG